MDLEEMEGGSPMTDEIDQAIDDAFTCSACGRIVHAPVSNRA